MLWPTYENKAGFPSTDPIGEMIRSMSGRVHVNIAVQDEDDEASARSLLATKKVPLDHVHFFQIEHGDIWRGTPGRNSLGIVRGDCASTTGISAFGATKSLTANSAYLTSRSTIPSHQLSKSPRSTRPPGLLPV